LRIYKFLIKKNL